MAIVITCKGAARLPLDAIEPFQGKYKKPRTRKDLDKIRASIEKHGFSFPFFVWNGDGYNRCIDGHGRLEALAAMREDGEKLPTFPVVYVDAASEAEAREKLLKCDSRYGEISIPGLAEFIEGLDIDMGDLSLPATMFAVEELPGMARGRVPGVKLKETSDAEIQAGEAAAHQVYKQEKRTLEFTCPDCGGSYFIEADTILEMLKAGAP